MIFCLLLATPAAAQFTLVSGAVTDANGVAYANGLISFQLVPSTGSPTLSGLPYTPPTGPIALDNTGSFTAQLADNNVLLPAGTKWKFSVTSPVIALPVGNGPQLCSATLKITGASQSISSSFNSCPALINVKMGTFGKPATSDALQYVSANGADTNDGLSWGTAKLTIAAAATALSSGGTIHVAPGYTGPWPASYAQNISVIFGAHVGRPGYYDVMVFGAKCDATVNDTTGAISGTNDATAIQNAINSLPGNTAANPGGVVFFPALCAAGSTINVASKNIHFESKVGQALITSAHPNAGIAYTASTGNAVYVTDQNFVLAAGIVTGSSGDAVQVTAGYARFVHARIYQALGSCGGCLPTASNGNGINLNGVQGSALIDEQSHISGFNHGVTADNTSLLTITGNTMLDNNMWGVFVTGGNALQIENSSLQTNTAGNIFVGANSSVRIQGLYMEIQNQSATNATALQIGSTTSSVGELTVDNLYLQCNSITAGAAIILAGLKAGYLGHIQFTNCGSGVQIIHNAGAGFVTSVYIGTVNFSPSNVGSSVFLDSIVGIDFDSYQVTAPAGAETPTFHVPLYVDAPTTAQLTFLNAGTGKWQLNVTGTAATFKDMTNNALLTFPPGVTGTLAVTGQLPLSGSVAGSTASLAANSCGDTVTATVTGATTSMVAQANSSAAFPATANGLTAWAAVTGANTVTVGYCNNTTASITPAAATIQIRVVQ